MLVSAYNCTAMKLIVFGLYTFLLFNVGSGMRNLYGDRYGVEWIFFPDGDGHPHFVNLTKDGPDERIMLRSRMNNDIEYRLYTRKNNDTFELLDDDGEVEDEICKNGCFIPNAPVKLVTHGWMSAADRSAVMLIKDAYLKNYDYNVIGIDWGSISLNLAYPFVAKETKYVGRMVGKFLKAMAQKYGIKGEQVHLIGHSLGAHVMGNAAARSGLKIGRITGLDPARPLFEFPMQDKSERLDPSDAQFVDIVHTCGGVLGVEGEYGHADFYPNSGFPPQPGCSGFQAMLEACSHGRAHAYFAEAIEKPRGFPSYKCKDWNAYLTNQCDTNNIVYMGENVDKNLRGSYYLSTNAFTPFALNNF